MEHFDGIEARSEHVHDVVSISVSGNDQEDGIVECCGLLDGSVDRNEYSGCAGRADVDWNQVLRFDQLTSGRCRILLPLRREYRFSIVGANFLDFRIGEALGQQYVANRPPPLVVPEFVRLFLLGDEWQAENVPPASRQQISRQVGLVKTLLDNGDRAPSRFVEAGADHVVEGLLNTVALGCRLRVMRSYGVVENNMIEPTAGDATRNRSEVNAAAPRCLEIHSAIAVLPDPHLRRDLPVIVGTR